jgi:NAD(P)-dependent dehydrogenase (short-subunit alcohol dehydrogenase family)
MRLEKKTAVIYGGGGAIGGAIARTFAREGATVYLAGPTAAKLDAVAGDIGPAAHTAVVDALDEAAVERHVADVVAEAGAVDVCVNAVGIQNGAQGKPLVEMSADEFGAPISDYTRTNFVTARAAARHMAGGSGGVIIGLSSPMARTATALTGSFTMASAAVELFLRQLAAETGPTGVRAVCLRLNGIPETATTLGSSTEKTWRDAAERLGVSFEELLEGVGQGSPLQRPLTVQEVADVAAFVASDAAGALTATVLNVTGGAVVD